MSRFEKIAGQLDAFNIDALLITSEANRLYASGFAASDGAVLVTKDGSWFFTDSRYIEAAKSSIEGAEVKEKSGKPLLEEIKNILKEKNAHILGFEEKRVTVSAYDQWKNALGCSLKGSEALLEELRSIKDTHEIQRLIAAQRLAEDAFQELLSFIRPGRTENEVSAYLQYLMLKRGAEGMSFPPIVISGERTSLPHGVPTEKVLKKGEFLTMDFGCVLDSYCSDTTRTIALGHITEEMNQVYQTVLSAQLAGIAAARAGETGKTIHEAAAKVIKDAGYGKAFRHSFGHGVGLEVHEAPMAAPSWDKPLPAGAVISAEPGIYLEGQFGVRIEDVIVLKENSSQNITNLDKELLIL